MQNIINVIKRVNIIIFGVVILTVVVGGVLMARYLFLNEEATRKSRADTTAGVNLSFNPAQVTARLNADFSVAIDAKASRDMKIRGYIINVSFDKNKLDLKHITYELGNASAGLADTNSSLTAINQRGRIHLQGESRESGGSIISSQQKTKLITLKFKLKRGPAQISISNATGERSGVIFYQIKSDMSFAEVPASSTISLTANVPGSHSTNTPIPTQSTSRGATNTPIPTQSTSRGATNTPTPTNTQSSPHDLSLRLALKFQGVLKKPAEARNKLNVRVGIKKAGVVGASIAYTQADFVSDDHGVWHGTANFPKNVLDTISFQAGGKYLIYIKGPKHIQKKVCKNNPEEGYIGVYHCSSTNAITLQSGANPLNFAGISMLAGDLPQQDGAQNGVVDSYDISVVRNDLGKTDAKSLSVADINLDGIVDTQDYALVQEALAIRYDDQ